MNKTIVYIEVDPYDPEDFKLRSIVCGTEEGFLFQITLLYMMRSGEYTGYVDQEGFHKIAQLSIANKDINKVRKLLTEAYREQEKVLKLERAELLKTAREKDVKRIEAYDKREYARLKKKFGGK